VSGKPVVVKIGGRALEAPGAGVELADAIAALGQPALLVHGGGAEVSSWSARLGITPRFRDGLRVTDAVTLEVATAVLAGLANKRFVAALRAAGVDAVGLSALDGGIAIARPHAEAVHLGEVGEVVGIRSTLLDTLLAQGSVPVLASIAACGGRLLNVNADDLAGAIAGALGVTELILLSDTPALMLEGAAVARLAPAAIEATLAHPDVQGGMKPKLHAARVALEGGVRRVHIAAWHGPGTLAMLLAGRGTATVIESIPTAEVTR
jgi:acetylglutamate kinase